MITLNDDTEVLARLLAERAGKTPVEFIRQTLEDRAKDAGIALPALARHKPSFSRMMEISDRFAGHRVIDDRSPDEIIGYDDLGAPR